MPEPMDPDHLARIAWLQSRYSPDSKAHKALGEALKRLTPAMEDGIYSMRGDDSLSQLVYVCRGRWGVLMKANGELTQRNVIKEPHRLTFITQIPEES